jgi:hypothetical protein
MNVEIGTETPIFLFWEYLFRNLGILTLQCRITLVEKYMNFLLFSHIAADPRPERQIFVFSLVCQIIFCALFLQRSLHIWSCKMQQHDNCLLKLTLKIANVHAV